MGRRAEREQVDGAFFCRRHKKASEQSELCSDVARCKGFEPLTFWFVAKHSIQLS